MATEMILTVVTSLPVLVGIPSRREETLHLRLRRLARDLDEVARFGESAGVVCNAGHTEMLPGESDVDVLADAGLRPLQVRTQDCADPLLAFFCRDIDDNTDLRRDIDDNTDLRHRSSSVKQRLFRS